jgi:hypothetical protein
VSAPELPLLARVVADLIAMDRDEVIDLSEWPALRELVEQLRYRAGILVLESDGPWEEWQLEHLSNFIGDPGVVVSRLPVLEPEWDRSSYWSSPIGVADISVPKLRELPITVADRFLTAAEADEVGLALIAAGRMLGTLR